VLLAGLSVILQRYVRAFSQPPHRFDERETFVLTNERENIASLLATKAVENLTLGTDIEARTLLLVKWAQRDEIRALVARSPQ
jgi:hypothetical protein